LRDADEALGTVGHFLATDAKCQPAVFAGFHGEVGKELVDVNSVSIGRSGAAGPAVFKRTLELSENSKAGAKVVICVEHVALEEISVVGIRVGSEEFVFVCLETLARVDAKREKSGACAGDGNVFHRVPELRGPRRVGEETVILIVAKPLEGRAGLVGRRSAGACLSWEKEICERDQ